jgi:hypothetical protein
MHHLWSILAVLNLLSLVTFPSRQRGQRLSQLEEMQRAGGIVLLVVFGVILFTFGIIWLGRALSHP